MLTTRDDSVLTLDLPSFECGAVVDSSLDISVTIGDKLIGDFEPVSITMVNTEELVIESPNDCVDEFTDLVILVVASDGVNEVIVEVGTLSKAFDCLPVTDEPIGVIPRPLFDVNEDTVTEINL